jgi:hypothetical protein
LARQRYEQLRSEALGVSTNVQRDGGLALLMRNGMALWMQAWASCTATHPFEVTQSVPLPAARHDVVAVLTELALAALAQESSV